LKQYRLAEKKGRTVSKLGRDILFIERSINFLKEGGRMAIVLPQGRLNNISDLYIRNFLFNKARILAVVGLHPNTFKPHAGTKTSILFLQKYTSEELAHNNSIISKELSQWEKHHLELNELVKKKNLTIEDLPTLLSSFLQYEFEMDIEIEEDENDTQINNKETEEDLTERIGDLKEQLESLKGRAKGKAALNRAILETKHRLTSKSTKGQLEWLLNEEKLLTNYRDVWVTEKTMKKLDYPIFFAVSEKGGKDNSGNPIFKKNKEGEIILDAHGHFIVDHDLDIIADKFINFAKKNNFYFWM